MFWEKNNHVAWLLSAGLIRDIVAERALQSLNVPMRQRVLNPETLIQQMLANKKNVSAQTSPILQELPTITFPALPT